MYEILISGISTFNGIFSALFLPVLLIVKFVFGSYPYDNHCSLNYHALFFAKKLSAKVFSNRSKVQVQVQNCEDIIWSGRFEC